MQISKFLRSNIVSIIIILIFGFIVILPDSKTIIIKGMMKTGLFNANAPSDFDDAKLIPEGISFRSENGQVIKLSEHKGKVFFINFWATWCPPCRAEMPSINALYKKVKNKDKIVFMMIDADNKPDEAVQFMRKYSYQLPVFVSASNIPKEIFNGTLPTTLIIGPDGKIVFQHARVADYDTRQMLDLLNKLAK